MKQFALFCALGCLAAPAMASDAEPASALKNYMACINAEATKQSGEDSDRISDPQTVIDNCRNQKQQVLQSLPKETANKLVAQIEKHLRDREPAFPQD